MAQERSLRFTLLFSFLSLLTLTAAQYNQEVTTIAAGQTSWYPDGNANNQGYTVLSAPPSGTVTVTTDQNGGTATTVVQGRSIPTLVYNCAYMPFICKNIENHVQNNGRYTFNSNGLMQLHLDVTGGKKADERRRPTCQSSRSLYRQKGFPNKCADIAALTGINTLFSRAFPQLPAESVPKTPKIILGPPDPLNPNDKTKNYFSGLMWTCDEFPSASWIEGGAGVSNNGFDAEVICAPQKAACSKSITKAFGAAVQALGTNPSEQDWQSSALGSLRAAVIRAHRISIVPAGAGLNQDSSDPFVGAFFLSTTTQAGAPQSRAWVVDEVKSTRSFESRVSTATSSALPKRSVIPFEPWTFNEIKMVGNASDLHVVPVAKPATRAAVYIPEASAGPALRRRYQLRGRSVTGSEVDAARTLIDNISPQIQDSNARRLAHPRVDEGDEARTARLVSLDESTPRPTKDDYKPISTEVREAAALLAEFDARNGGLEFTWPNARPPRNSSSIFGNATSQERIGAASSYWYSQISPKGKSPFHPMGSQYQVYKNAITDCGAAGDGVTDDTKAIQDCIAAQNRCGGDSLECASTSVMPLTVYFPSGTYLVSSTIEMYFQTLIVGDPVDRPVFLAARSFQGLGVLSSDHYIEGADGASWYINQNNFMRQVRNVIIDIRNTPDNPRGVPAPGPACLHWQVAQATSLQNIDFYMKEGSRGHVGVFMENGSGGLITGLNFHGGYIGLRAGNQQFTIKNLVFANCRTAIQAIWDWTFLWQNIQVTGANIGIDLINQDLKNDAKPQQTFAYLLVDSAISATTGIRTNPFMGSDGYAQLTLDNVDFGGSGTAVKQTTGEVVLAGSPHVDMWMWGIVASRESPTGRQVRGEAATPLRAKPAGLLGGPRGGYFDKPKPQYESVDVGAFRNALTNGCKGDGVSDDTACLQALFGSPGYVFVPAGVYRVTDTIKVVPGVKMVGEAWSAITAAGDKFGDMAKPRVMLQVGETGQVGDVEIVDMLFQVEGAAAGAVLVEWNMRASSPGSAGMWDSHFRVGGNAGSGLQAKDCPRLSGTINPKCIACNMLLHITAWGSGYFENVWAWVADHDLETPEGVQIDIYSARGMLIESTHPTWLYASASEHNVLYQYMIRGANNLFLGMIQTESPYYQSTPPAPQPFEKSVGRFIGDPSYSDCKPGTPGSCMAWGVMVEQSSNVFIYGAGTYSWFQKYNQNCLSQFNCQQKMISLKQSRNIYIYNLATVGTESMISSPGARLDAQVHNSARSNVSSLNGWLGDADGTADEGNAPNATITLPTSIWLWPETQSDGGGTMTVACTPPCVFSFPPLTYPPLQPPPLTTSLPGMGVVTVTPPAVTSATLGWEVVTYRPEEDGDLVSTVTPVSNQTEIPVPPWSCGDECGGNVVTFPPIPIPIPMPTDAPCWILCDTDMPQHPPVVIGPGPPPGPPPPGTDNNSGNNTGIVDPPLPGCNPKTCPSTCSDCEQGSDCDDDDDCLLGGTCVGPKCTSGGGCKGPRCEQGGDCRGDNCESGGDCEGDHCTGGGDCVGLLCLKGGDCIGLLCTHGGGCSGPKCTPGGCTGPNCGKGPCTGSGCDTGPCTGPNCDSGGCTGPSCGGGGSENGEEGDGEEEEEEFFCLVSSETPNVDTTDDTGMGVSGHTGTDSDSGGNVGQGGINGSGTGCRDDDTGAVVPCGGGGGDVTTKPPTTSSAPTTRPTTTRPTTTTKEPPPTTTEAPKPSHTWHLTLYKGNCKDDITDYYSLQGYGEQGPNEECINLTDPKLPQLSDTSASCRFFTDGGFKYGPCSGATFDEPGSFVIRGGFCTPYETADCDSGGSLHGGVSSDSDVGCTQPKPNMGLARRWRSMRCFAFPRD